MEHLGVLYHLAVDPDHVETRADALALEQTVEVPRAAVKDPFVEQEVLARVEAIEPDPSGGFRVRLEIPLAAIAANPAQLLNVFFGKSALHDDVRVLDLCVPETLREAFGGPRLGLAGLRERLGIERRPMTMTALKPMGLSVDRLADLCATFSRAGIDVIKDDDGLADFPFCPFEERVVACLEATERVADETGRRSLYAPGLVGGPKQVFEQLETAERLGAQAVLVSPMLLGLPVLHDLARANSGLAILAHPTFVDRARIAPDVWLGTLWRLFGADAVIFPGFGGRFTSWDQATCRKISEALLREEKPLEPSLPVTGGGMSVDAVPGVVGFYGNDVMLLIGGSLYLAGDSLLERSRSFVENVKAAARP